MCDDMALCKDCAPSVGCWARENAKIYGINEYGPIVGEDAIIEEVYKRGPYNILIIMC